MNVAEAVDTYEDATREIQAAELELAGAKARQKQAAVVLKDWCREHGKTQHKWSDRVGYQLTTTVVLDQGAAKARLAELGELDELLVDRVTEKLTLLDV